jgi:hypothetical protein
MVKGNVPTAIFKEDSLTMTPNLVCWSTEKQGYLGEMMEFFYNERVKVQDLIKEKEKRKEKTDALNVLQESIKLLMNSGYGAFGNQYFRLFDLIQWFDFLLLYFLTLYNFMLNLYFIQLLFLQLLSYQ